MAFFLLPFFLIRFGLLALFNKAAVKRAAYFAPLHGKEKAAYWLYQISNAAILVYLLLGRYRPAPAWLFCAGLAVYTIGLVLLAVSVVNFAAPAKSGISQKGLYRLSRNPMYLAYFIFFTGCALIAQSPLLFGLTVVFQTAAHWIILAEERWCTQHFGEEYLSYMKKVRRYL